MMPRGLYVKVGMYLFMRTPKVFPFTRGHAWRLDWVQRVRVLEFLVPDPSCLADTNHSHSAHNHLIIMPKRPWWSADRIRWSGGDWANKLEKRLKHKVNLLESPGYWFFHLNRFRMFRVSIVKPYISGRWTKLLLGGRPHTNHYRLWFLHFWVLPLTLSLKRVNVLIPTKRDDLILMKKLIFALYETKTESAFDLLLMWPVSRFSP